MEKDNQEVIEVKRKRLPFTMVENAIIQDERLNKSDVMVYLILCMHADKNGKDCYPSIKTIARESRSSKDTVIESIKNLVKYDYLIKERRMDPNNPKRCINNLYTITGGVVGNKDRGSRKEGQGGSRKEGKEQDPSFELDPHNNNTAAAISVFTEKNGKIEFTWPEVQNICNKVSNTKEFVINRIDMAISRIDKFPEPRTNVKGWIIKAIIDGYDLDTEPQETDADFEKEDRQILDRDQKENDFTLRDILAARKEALNNPVAQEFFSLAKTLNGGSNINQMIVQDDKERQIKLHKSGIETGKQKVLQAV